MSELANKMLMEADWSEDPTAFEEIIDLIVENPKQVGRAYPPLGYEEVLLKKLRRKTQSRFSLKRYNFFEILNASKLGWALSVFLLASTVLSTWRLLNDRSDANGFAQNAIHGIMNNSEKGELKRWLASLGAAAPLENTEVQSLDLLASDPFIVAFELNGQQLERVLEKFSQDVRKTHSD